MGKANGKGEVNRGQRPQNAGQILPVTPAAQGSTDSETPVFCLHHLVRGYDVGALDQEGRSEFALTLASRCQLTWAAIKQAPRHALGTEMIPADQIRATIPAQFSDADRFMMFRYHGKLPMGGVRSGATFHVIWIEKKFGDLYDHGS